jgi:hypothetical protein
MGMRGRILRTALALGLGLWLTVAGCGDDDLLGPGFGDLELSPGFQEIGAARNTTVILSNVSDVALGPIVVRGEAGQGTRLISGELCSAMVPDVTPSAVGSLAPGAEVEIAVTFDLAGVTVQECPGGDWDVDITAAVDSRGLASATIRLSFSGED